MELPKNYNAPYNVQDVDLSPQDEAMLHGEAGEAAQIAMRILLTMAKVYGASSLLSITSAHIDGCLYHGDSGIDFAQKLVDGGAKVVVPTTLNVGAIDLLHPEHFQGTREQADKARLLMDLYRRMNCQQIWTCAPYQAVEHRYRPQLGEQIAWAESNAIVFANSVLGARTNRYGDFIDICAAITGRAPAVGLHLQENRRAEVIFDVTDIPDSLLYEDVFYPVLGYFIGRHTASKIPAIVGLPETVSEDKLKALGAAAASSGAVALFHAVGITPEAATLEDALQGQSPEHIAEYIKVSMTDLKVMRDSLSVLRGDKNSSNIDVVALGSPHFSLAECEELLPLLREKPPISEFIVCTNRFVLSSLEARGLLDELKELGVRVVVDTCVVVTPIVKAATGILMTNSGKFAHYTPGNIGFEVVFGSLRECVYSAAQGYVWRDETLW